MSDFLISDARGCADRFARILSQLTRIDELAIKKSEGPWGSLAVAPNHYQGYQTYEDDRQITVVVGGPLLRVPSAPDDNVPQCSRHTASVLRHIFESPSGDWHNDLLGPFCFLHVDKMSGHFTIVTDNMSFIPAYAAESIEPGAITQHALSTHSDAAALAVHHDGPCKFDPVSVCDFILHKKVTYPHTFYSNVKELAPATIHSFTKHDQQESAYWRPRDDQRPRWQLNVAAGEAREALVEVIQRAAEEYGRLCFFLSAGEDTRTLVCMAPKDVDVHCISIAPSRNREARIAQRVARALNVTWEFVEQPPSNYLSDLGRRALLSGSNGLSIAAHVMGVMQESSLADQPVVIGGLTSDVFLKGYFYRSRHLMRGVAYQRFVSNRNNIDVSGSGLIDDDIVAEILSRRRAHENRLREFRTTTVNEWMACWPISQGHEIVNLWSNRRLFVSVEAFMCPKILEIAACLPPDWVVNRKFFQKMAAPFLRKLWWIPHGDGHYPAFPWYANLILQPLVRTGRHLMRFGRREGSLAWPTPASHVASPLFQQVVHQHASHSAQQEPVLRHAVNVSRCQTAHPTQRLAGAQVLASVKELQAIASRLSGS